MAGREKPLQESPFEGQTVFPLLTCVGHILLAPWLGEKNFSLGVSVLRNTCKSCLQYVVLGKCSSNAYSLPWVSLLRTPCVVF